METSQNIESLEALVGNGKSSLSQVQARLEAERCLYCSGAPCQDACPTSIDIPRFIRQIASGDGRGAGQTVLSSNMLGYSCAHLCPVEELCEGACVHALGQHSQKPIAIGRLQRFATEQALAHEAATGRKLFSAKPSIGKSVALVGAGPASLACAAELVLNGVNAVIFERKKRPGGLNSAGIAPYKLTVDESLREIEWLQSYGVEIRTDQTVGVDVSGAELLDQFDTVFLGTGLGSDRWLDIPGIEGPGVVGATSLIEKIKCGGVEGLLDVAELASKNAVVLGGGNTAIDVARALARLGTGEVTMVYRSSAEQMSGYQHEMVLARQEGVRLREFCQPVGIRRSEHGGGSIAGVLVRSTNPDASSVEVEEISANLVVFAIGQKKLVELQGVFPDIQLTESGCVEVDETFRTTHPRIYAGGDCVNGGKEVVNAVAHGRDAAHHMLKEFLSDG